MTTYNISSDVETITVASLRRNLQAGDVVRWGLADELDDEQWDEISAGLRGRGLRIETGDIGVRVTDRCTCPSEWVNDANCARHA